MGFDIECIIDIQTYLGEYFCPVCNTLVYPNEALQSQCSHLHCKPCLAHIAYGSKACPYDGYLVTESDSKGNDWTSEGSLSLLPKWMHVGGILSEITTHCSECSFGISPVLCNRCGVLIHHNQVEDHAQICTDAYEAQVAIESVPWTTSLGRVSSAYANTYHSVVQSGPPVYQSQNLKSARVYIQPQPLPLQQFVGD